MLIHPILDKLRELNFKGMLHALEEQLQQTTIEALGFEERLVHKAHKIELKGESMRKKKSLLDKENTPTNKKDKL